MAAHLRPAHQPTCARCGKRATVVLHNTSNAPISEYCLRCGNQKLKEFCEKYPDEGPFQRYTP